MLGTSLDNMTNPEESKMTHDNSVETLESYCPNSRVHALIHNPTAEGIDEG